MSAEPDTGADGAPLRVVIVTGIFPPDIGGPATHSADLQVELRARGHDVTVVSLTDASRRTDRDQVLRLPRRWPWAVRLIAVAAWLARNRRNYDVVYATGLHPAAVAGARLARKPVVVKVVGDPAWERGTRLALTARDFDGFQQDTRGPMQLRLMRALRDWSVRHAGAVTVPSAYLRRVAEGWMGTQAKQVRVIPNGVRASPTDKRDVSSTLRLASVGRLVTHKRIDVVLDALSRVHDAELLVIGEGPERTALETEASRRSISRRVTFTGSLGHGSALQHLGRSDALVVASSYEGLPHVVIEAFALGVPVVASAAGGVSEVVTDGLNGLIIDPPDAASLAAAFARLRDDSELRTKLSAGAREAGAQWRFDRCADEIEALLRTLLARRPRIVNLGKTWIDNPPRSDLEGKLQILARHLDATIVSTGAVGVRRVAGVRLVGLPAFRPRMLGGLVFYPAAALVAVTGAALRPGTAVVCQSPFEALGVLVLRELVPRKRRPRVVVEVHGDWRTASRLYGGPVRRVLAPLADVLAARALGRADRVRAVGAYTGTLVRAVRPGGAADHFPAFIDLHQFLDADPTPMPSAPTALFVGALERVKGIDLLLTAWPDVVASVPDAHLTIIGDGSLTAWVRAQVRELRGVQVRGRVSPVEVRNALDKSSFLVLPSRSEGLGRVVIESFARGRPAVASRVGGVPDLITHNVDGVLVDPGDRGALVEQLVRLLTSPSDCRRLGAAAKKRALALDSPAAFESGIARLACWVQEKHSG